MENIKEISILKGKIVNLLHHYVEEFKPKNHDIGFNIFSDEDILYALLEYSKYSRKYSSEERFRYIYDKCVSFSGKGLQSNQYKIIRDYDGSLDIVPKEELPF